MKRKPTYEQALGLERGQATARANRRRTNLQTSVLTAEQKTKWDTDKAAAVAAYRKKKAAT